MRSSEGRDWRCRPRRRRIASDDATAARARASASRVAAIDAASAVAAIDPMTAPRMHGFGELALQRRRSRSTRREIWKSARTLHLLYRGRCAELYADGPPATGASARPELEQRARELIGMRARARVNEIFSKADRARAL